MDIILRASDLTKERVLNVIKFDCAVGLSTVSKNDFEFSTKLTPDLIAIGKYITYGNTEYGGKITERIIDTGKGIVTYRGKNFRGLLTNLIMEYEQSFEGNIDFDFRALKQDFYGSDIRTTLEVIATLNRDTIVNGYWNYDADVNVYKINYKVPGTNAPNTFKIYDAQNTLIKTATKNGDGRFGDLCICRPIYCEETNELYLYTYNTNISSAYRTQTVCVINWADISASPPTPLDEMSVGVVNKMDYEFVQTLLNMRESPKITYNVVATANATMQSRTFASGTNYLTAIEQWLSLFGEKFTLSFDYGTPIVNISPVTTIAKQDASRSSVVLSENQSVPNAIYSENGAKYIQEDGTVGATKYYAGDTEIAIWSGGTALADLSDELIKARDKSYASDINAEITTGDVGDLVEATVAELGVKATQKIVEKTLTYARGQEKIVYSTGG